MSKSTKKESKAILKKSKGKGMAQIPQREILEAMKELSNGAQKLLWYYYSRNDGWVFSDKNIANAILHSERQVKAFRLELIKHKYLLVQRGEVDVYFIGKKSVHEFEHPNLEEEDEAAHEPLVSKRIKGQ